MLSNHYHFVALAPEKPGAFKAFVQHLHSLTAREINREDKTPGRKVWFQCWDSHLTYRRSYFARLAYVHQNAVRHGLVQQPGDYLWCSARWFETQADRTFYRTIMSFPIDRLEIPDDF